MPTPLLKAPQLAPRSSLPLGTTTPRVAPWGPSEIEWAESPARLLHERLVETFATPAPADTEQVLSPRARLSILLGASVALWLVIALAVAAIA